MKLFVFALALALLAGCDLPRTSTPLPQGHEVSPPPGWLDYCTRNPKDVLCHDPAQH